MAAVDSETVSISEASVADTTALVALDQRNFPSSGDWFDRRLWMRILGDRARRGEMLTLVAQQHGELLGAIVGHFRGRQAELVVWSIAVDEKLRGSGLAQRLLAELLARTPASYRTISLEARQDNLRARRFYERLSFRSQRRVSGAYADGTAAIRYTADADQVRALMPPIPWPTREPAG